MVHILAKPEISEMETTNCIRIILSKFTNNTGIIYKCKINGTKFGELLLASVIGLLIACYDRCPLR